MKWSSLFRRRKWDEERAREIDSYQKVVDLGWARMGNSKAVEHATALIEIAKIANYRFDDLVADANPIQSSHTFDLGR